MSLVVRKSEPDDYPNIRRMLSEASEADRRYLAYDFKRRAILDAARRGRHCLVADDDGDLVGFLRESGRPGGGSHMEELYVPPHARGNGVASMMMKTYHSEYPATSAKTKPDNAPMKRLLRRNGYRVVDPEAKNVLLWERSKQ